MFNNNDTNPLPLSQSLNNYNKKQNQKGDDLFLNNNSAFKKYPKDIISQRKSMKIIEVKKLSMPLLESFNMEIVKDQKLMDKLFGCIKNNKKVRKISSIYNLT